MTQDVYRDTDWRYHNDPEFHNAVKAMEELAVHHGFTPGELKQIAFKAALNIEERRFDATYKYNMHKDDKGFE